ncbi:MAG: hypothetical protein WAS21_14755, partial [Geminicoccaceae bacterium]
VSVTPAGGQANGSTSALGLSDDARFQLMATWATNLVGGVGGTRWGKLVLRDQRTGALQRVDVGSNESAGTGIPGVNWGSLAAGGRYIAFSTDRDGLTADDHDGDNDMFVRDIVAGTTVRLRVGVGGTLADSYTYELGISADGRYVLFLSAATNLLPGGSRDQHIYRHDRQRGVTVQVDGGLGGTAANGLAYGGSLSADGRRAAFYSEASNLVAVDSNGKLDVFVRDIGAGKTSIVSTGYKAGQQSTGTSENPIISGDGRFVAFQSTAAFLVPNDTNNRIDVFVRDLARGVTERVSIGSAGKQATARSELDHISSTGRYVVFRTLATNLGSLPDTNKDYDLYVRDREAGSTRRVSVGLGDRSPNERSILGFASTNGTVLFDSHASNIVAGDTNGEPDTFVRAPAP